MDGRSQKRGLAGRLFRLLFGLALVYVVLSVVLAVPFSNILFKPHARPALGVPSLVEPGADKLRAQWVAADSLRVDVLTVTSNAGPKPISLSVWWIFRDSSRHKPTVAFLAGNGGLEPADYEDKVRFLCRMGFNCFLLDQRGFGASAGELLTHGWYERGDFAAVVDTLVNRYGIDAGRMGIWGLSMGASNAVNIAASRPEIKALLLYAPWSDPLPMAVHYVWRSYSVPKFLLYFPVWTAIKIGTSRSQGGILDPAEEAKKIRCPALVVHGDQDDIAPPKLTERLFHSLGGPKEEVAVPGAHHNDLLDMLGPEKYLEQMKRAFSPLLHQKTH